MKLIVRALVLSVCAAGASAAVASTYATPLASHLAMTASMPTPTCDPGAPCHKTELMPTPTCDPGAPCHKTALMPTPTCDPGAPCHKTN